MQVQFSLDTSSCKWSIPEVRCSATASSPTAGHDYYMSNMGNAQWKGRSRGGNPVERITELKRQKA